MADAGVASRRACEDLIRQGRVSVNGIVVRELGSKVDPINTKVEVDGEAIKRKTTNTYIAFHKPKGVLSTMIDPEGRRCLGDFFSGRNERLFHVGRLDRDSEGLILLTNDGELTHKVTHPSYRVEKVYFVDLFDPLSKEEITELQGGIRLEDGLAKALKVETSAGQPWARITIHEGRYHIIRRMFDEIEHPVKRLTRLAFGPIQLGELPAGKWREMNNNEVISLFKAIESKR